MRTHDFKKVNVTFGVSIVSILFFLSCPAAAGQSVIYKVSGNAANQQLGKSIAAGGDFNADGIVDFSAGAPGAAGPAGNGAGSVRVFSGPTGSSLLTIFGTTAGEALGTSLAFVGDVNQDNIPDLLSGAPSYQNAQGGRGAARMLNGAGFPSANIWSILAQFTFSGGFGPCTGIANTFLGADVSTIGDVNGDAIPDVLVVDPGFSKAFIVGSGTCKLQVVGNASVVNGQTGLSAGANFQSGSLFVAGFVLKAHAIGDVTNDGKGDVAVMDELLKTLKVASANGSVHFTKTFTGNINLIPRAIAGAGDVNFDGRSDILFQRPGGFDVFSGANGAIVFALNANTGETLGSVLAGVGDVDLDGIPDFASLVTGPAGSPSKVKIYSGVNGVEFMSLASSIINDGFGASFASGDFNADGYPEFAVGAPTDSLTLSNSGSVYVMSSIPNGISYFGTGVAGCAGPHSIITNFAPKIGNFDVEIRWNRAPAGMTGLGIVGLIPNFSGTNFFGIGVPVYVDIETDPSVVGFFNMDTDMQGFGFENFPIANDPALVGLNVYVEGLVAWTGPCQPTSPYGLSATSGMTITIQAP